MASDEGARPLVRPGPVRVGGVELDFVRRAAVVGGAGVHLSGSALSLLYLLAANAGRVVTRDEIQGVLWEPGHAPTSNSVDRLVHDLRRALDDCWARPRFVETIVGGGYRFVPGADAHPVDEPDAPNTSGDDASA